MLYSNIVQLQKLVEDHLLKKERNMAVDKRELVNVFDYESAARAILPKMAYDYYRSGANDEITLRENHSAYEGIRLKPRVLRDISKRDLTTTILGQTVSMPISLLGGAGSGSFFFLASFIFAS